MKKVAVIRPGIHTIDEQFCYFLAKNKYKVTLIAPQNSVVTPNKISKLNYKVILLPRLNIFNVNGFPFMPSLYSFLKKNNFDIVQPGEDFQINTWIATIYSWIHKKALFLIEEKYFYSRYKIFKYIIKTFDIIGITKLIWKLSPKIISHGSETTKFLLKRGCRINKIITIPLGVNPKIFPSKSKYKTTGCYELLTVARFIPHKGLNTLIDAIKMIKINCHLTIIGSGELKVTIENKIKENNLNQKIKIIKSVPFRKLFSYYHAADIYICSSIFEVASNSVLEAMSCGLPVVTTNAGSTKDFIVEGYNGYICNKGDVLDLKDKILKLLNFNIIKKFGINSRKRSQQEFDWNILIKKYIDIFSKKV